MLFVPLAFELMILIWPLAQVLGKTCARGQIRIWPFIVPAAHEELEIVIWPLVQVLGNTFARGLIKIWPYIVPTAHEGSEILIKFWAKPN